MDEQCYKWKLTAITNFTELAVDPDNANHVVISVGGYTATQKVWETFNANLASPTWTKHCAEFTQCPNKLYCNEQ
jgi:xanthine dehydrogenase iron-sulfur cluster and FAD-binding subunit A